MDKDFPPNSHKAKADATPTDKRVEQVTSASAKRRKKSLGKQFKSTFVAGDIQSATHYVFFQVLLPSAKDMFVEAVSSGIEKVIYGEARPGPRRGGMRPPSGPQGHIAYNRMGGAPNPRAPQISQQSRARNNFDEIVLDSRTEAEEVLERLFELTSKYEAATLADLYALVGIDARHTDYKWGWRSLEGAHVSRIRTGGYLLDLPDPEEL